MIKFKIKIKNPFKLVNSSKLFKEIELKRILQASLNLKICDD